MRSLPKARILLLLIGLAVVITTAACIGRAMLAPLTAAQPAAESPPYLLDRLATDSGKTVYRLIAAVDRQTFAHYSFDRHTSSRTTLHVTRHTLDSGTVPFAQVDARRQEFVSSESQFPWWNAGYLPPAEFRLPSGRLVEDNGEIYLIVAADRTLTILHYSTADQTFVPFAGTLTAATRRRIFAETFSADDVYWTYALVTNADYFLHGANIASDTNETPGDLPSLRTEWERRQTGL